MLKKFLLLLLIPLIFCGCTRDDREIITFSSWGSITETQILEHLIDDFQKQNSDIKVNFIHIPQNYFQKLHLLFASSTEPDVIFINNLYLPVYANKLQDLSDYFDISPFYPQAIEALSYENIKLAIPRDISNFVLYYNKDIIGKDLGKEITFEEFDKLIKSNATKQHFGVSFEPDIYWAEPYTLTLGYDKGIEYYKSLEGRFAPTPADIGSSTLTQMFLDKKLAFLLSGRWMYPKISSTSKFRYGIIPFAGTVPADASGWAISKSTKHLGASVKFVQYLSSYDSIKYFTETGLIVPARKDVSKIFTNSYDMAFLDAISKSKSIKRDKSFAKERDELNKKLFNK